MTPSAGCSRRLMLTDPKLLAERADVESARRAHVEKDRAAFYRGLDEAPHLTVVGMLDGDHVLLDEATGRKYRLSDLQVAALR